MELSLEQALQQGISSHKDGDLQEAERIYRAILEIHPAHPHANHNLGVLAVSVNKVGEALPFFKAALKADSTIEQFWLSYIDALIKEQMYEASQSAIAEGKTGGLSSEKLAALEARLTQARDDTTPPTRKLDSLLSHYQAGRYGDAEELAKTFTQKFPEHPFGWKILGAVLAQTGRKFEALDANEKFVELSPDDAEAHNNFGVILKEVGKLTEAEQSLKKAIGLKENFAEAHNNLGVTYKELGRFEDAVQSLKEAIACKPDYAEAFNNLGGSVLLKMGRLAEAELNLKQAISLKPDFAEAHNNLGVTLHLLNRLEDAEESLEQATGFKTKYAEAHNNLANTLKEMGQFDKAEISYKKAISFNAQYAEAFNNLGVILNELGKFDEAIESFGRAIEIRPKYVEAFNNLGTTLHRVGKIEKALNHFGRALELDPNNASARLNRWHLLFEEGNFEAALRDAEFCDTKKSRVCVLETLYAMDRIKEIYERVEIQPELDDVNIEMAAFTSFIDALEKKDTAHNFCKNPLSFMHFSNISSDIENPNTFIEEISKELDKIKTIWQPPEKSTRKGFQSLPYINIFEKPSTNIDKLKSIILDELDKYYLKYYQKECLYIQKWPTEKNIWGWHVILKRYGHQNLHIHPEGWLSGVVYLKVSQSKETNEGAIEFSLNGINYSNIKSPKLVYQPKIGDIVFFPSSLHHRTIPFTSDTDRIIISFDLLPEK